jgi:uncharacterized protein (TIGR02996 family)
MTERDAFIRSIVENPADDTTRLAFADWLDEHDEPELAEFIRVQVKLGDTRRYNPPRGFGKLVKREEKLLAANEKTWLGILHNLNDEERFHAIFRRGFVSKLVAEARDVFNYAITIGRQCPVLEEVDATGVRYSGSFLARAPCLNTVRTLRLEDWPMPTDAKALAACPYLLRVEHLSLWIGSRNDAVVCRTLGAAKNMPALKRIELIQLLGGMQAGTDAAVLAEHADEMAALVNAGQRKPVAVVSRPFEQLFPLAPDIGRDLYAGVLPNGRQVLARWITPHPREWDTDGSNWEFLHFDADGRLTGAERSTLADSAPKKTKLPYTFKFTSDVHRSLVEWLWRNTGFRSATIRVREFEANTVIPGHELAIYKFGRRAYDAFVNPDGRRARANPAQTSRDVRAWLRDTQFVIAPYGSEYWADDSGTIVAT